MSFTCGWGYWLLVITPLFRWTEILQQANVMLSYKIPEAIELLTTKLKNAEVSLQSLQDDLEFLREQITVMEVNTARLYNWDVVRRRERRAKEAAASTG